ncbi:MAG: DNA polymerase III subunit chi [Gammaproteobacteria bacterium]
MTRIDFYILDTANPHSREKFACRLIEKAQSQGHQIHVQSHGSQHAKLLDDLLWSFKSESFIPHAMSDSTDALNCSVIIEHKASAATDHNVNDVLINFDTTVPVSFSQYSRVIEIVNKKDNSSIEGRSRYTYYKDRGYKMESHNIRG